MLEKVCREIIEKALKKPQDKKSFEKLKIKASRDFELDHVIKNSEILEFCTEYEEELLKPLLLKKPTRSISGVSVVAVMARPYDCPHGVCVYCPRGKDSPQSYTGKEPATRRAGMNRYNPFLQTQNRLEQLKAIGHPIDKIELIVMGGTFTAQPFTYQKKFVKGCLEAMAGKSKNFEQVKEKAEHSKVRPTGITFETRPDYCKEKEIKKMLELGATRVELGVQTIYDSIYEKIERCHTVSDVIEATKLLKDSGLKVCYHLMPGLPGSSRAKDLEMFKEIFSNPDFKPDMLKVYPTLVIEKTKLYDWWKAGKYKPLNSEQAAEIIALAKKKFPKWVRIMRVTRDIPANLISAGVKKSNLRELVNEKMQELGAECKCIRCREVGHKFRKEHVLPEKIEIREQKYKASQGTEYFISAEDFEQNILIGYLRLRITSEGKAIIRELHVYGPEVIIGNKAKKAEFQHKGWGKKLLKRAESIARDLGKDKILVLSGIGAKEYYRKLGYNDYGFYLEKKFK